MTLYILSPYFISLLAYSFTRSISCFVVVKGVEGCSVASECLGNGRVLKKVIEIYIVLNTTVQVATRLVYAHAVLRLVVLGYVMVATICWPSEYQKQTLGSLYSN